MGDFVQVVEQYRYATKIRTINNVEGWVHTDYLVDRLDNVWWRVKEGRTLRSGPGSRYADLGTVAAGSKVKVLDYDLGQDSQYKHWYKIRTTSGQTGWIWGAQTTSNTGANIVRYEFDKEGKVVDYLTPFTPLDTKSSVTAQQINQFIDSNTNGKTLMTGMGAAFIKAGQLTGLNPIYLMAHAAHETGWGRSVIVKDKYNFYGIGAIDSNPYEGAYGYDNPEDGIIAGAMWIDRNYVDHATYQQKTLDNMRNNNQSHQYATDEAWHVKIVEIAQRFYQFIKGNK
jgi:beta-N-acetylglucosaminidase